MFKKALCFAIAFGVVSPVSALDISMGIYGKHGLDFSRSAYYGYDGVDMSVVFPARKPVTFLKNMVKRERLSLMASESKLVWVEKE
ncbi:MAG: hypothetical protein LBI42_08240 [Chitinispirillales bacterium]|jgi:hypothetical protein|nr:hypothetical protein [Chitinispirillales bacterium]